MRRLALSLLLATAVHAQTCTFQPLPGPSHVSTDLFPHSCTVWDEDGAGPLPPVVVAVGSFHIAGDQYARGIATWDGERWTSLNRTPMLPDSVGVFDPDGPGPAPERLVLSAFWREANGYVNHVSWWNSGRWMHFPSIPTFGYAVFTSFDPDGSGPLPPSLIAAGQAQIAGDPRRMIARWDGAQWQPLGSGLQDSTPYGWVRALAVYDTDGEGPLPARLYAAGNFIAAGGQPANGIASWDGQSWAPLGAGAAGIQALCTFDPDGAGPAAELLIAGGTFSQAGSVQASRIAAWNGTQWSALSNTAFPTGAVVTSLAVQRPLPTLSILNASVRSFPGGGVFRRVGEQWERLPDVPGGSILLTFPRAHGPELLIQYGQYAYGPRGTSGFSIWDGAAWRRSFHGFINDDNGENADPIASFDPDGPGPRPSELVFGRAYYPPEPAAPIPEIVANDGSGWRALPGWPGGTALALFPFEPSGPGGPGARLIASVSPAAALAWDGDTWSSLGPVPSDRIFYGFCAHDTDGNGPLPPSLAAFGSGPGFGFRISLWDGAQWELLSPEIYYQDINPPWPWVDHIISFDRDGAGPALPQLYIAGQFNRIGQASIQGFARLNGMMWEAIPGNLIGQPASIVDFDLDGPGPLGTELIMCGNGNSLIWAFNGSTWRVIPLLPESGPPALVKVDLGTGPILVAFRERVYFWNGAGWSSLGVAGASAGTEGPPAVWRPQGRPPELWWAGEYVATAGPWPSFAAVRFGCPGPLCYANCDSSTISPVLNVSDFLCFINRFQAQDPYANCDGSSADPFLNVADFNCFLNRFTAGCP